VVDEAPLSDGGEGFCEHLTRAAQGQVHAVEVAGPLGDRVVATVGVVEADRLPAAARARLGAVGGQRIAVVEMAAASGLGLVAELRRDVWSASSRGTGELLLAAARLGVDRIVLGIGGSATSDLGLGALAALGLRFGNEQGQAVDPVPHRFSEITQVSAGSLHPLPPVCVACDVDAPLFGSRGAAAVFGPQKGLLASDLPRFEAEARRLARLTGDAVGADTALQHQPAAGAAGGMGWGLAAAVGARTVPGFDLVADWLDLDARMIGADHVLTGEGRFDATSLAGKGPYGVVQRAQRCGRPCSVFAGAVQLDGVHLDQALFADLIAISPPNLPLNQAIAQTSSLLDRAIQDWLGCGER
jgi:glycerate kinase